MAALVFGDVFFPEYSSTAGTLAAFATFGVGFLFRPLGGIIFGHFGDKLGRRGMLVWTIVLMGAATTLIGVLPTYAMIGWGAPALLVLLRCVQGVAVGGEWGGAALMAVESAPKGLKAFYSSGVQMGYAVALLLVTGLVTALNGGLSADAFLSWGWRVPFLISFVLVLVGLWIRSGVEESEEFVEKVASHEPAESAKLPVLQSFRRYPVQIAQIFGLRLIELLTMYIVTTFALAYTTDELGMSRSLMLTVTLVVGALGLISIPTFAYLSDRYGRRRIYLTGGVIGLLTAVPFFLFLERGSVVGIVVCAILLINVSHDAVVSVQQPLFAQMFSPEFRYSGAGVGYQLASAIAGGFTPFLATWLVGVGDGSWYLVAAYLGLGCLISVLIMAFMRHTEEPAETADPAGTAAPAPTTPEAR